MVRQPAYRRYCRDGIVAVGCLRRLPRCQWALFLLSRKTGAPLSKLPKRCYCRSMAITEQIADFTAFARLLVQQEGDNISLDDAYQQWKEIDPDEVAVLQNRLESYDAGEQGQPADVSMAELRKRLLTKFGK